MNLELEREQEKIESQAEVHSPDQIKERRKQKLEIAMRYKQKRDEVYNSEPTEFRNVNYIALVQELDEPDSNISQPDSIKKFLKEFTKKTSDKIDELQDDPQLTEGYGNTLETPRNLLIHYRRGGLSHLNTDFFNTLTGSWDRYTS